MGKRDLVQPVISEAKPFDVMSILPIALCLILAGVCFYLFKYIKKTVDENKESKGKLEEIEEFVEKQNRQNGETFNAVNMLLQARNPNQPGAPQGQPKPQQKPQPKPQQRKHPVSNLENITEHPEGQIEEVVEEEEVEELDTSVKPKKGVINILG